MYKIAHKTELERIAHLPKEVFAIVQTTVAVLDNTYGIERDVDNSDGGYVVILEEADTFDMLTEIGLDVDSLCPEYTEKVNTSTILYAYSMILFNNEFSITLLMPYSIAMSITGFLDVEE